MAAQTPLVYDFTLNDIDGKPVSQYLVDRTGKIVARYRHRTKPFEPENVHDVERALAAQVFR
jgi:hypothetical protein